MNQGNGGHEVSGKSRTVDVGAAVDDSSQEEECAGGRE